MWTEGKLKIRQKNGKYISVHYWVKHYEEPSGFGIDEGKISKLTLKINNRITVNYDRGWGIKPEDDVSSKALERLIKQYN